MWGVYKLGNEYCGPGPGAGVGYRPQGTGFALLIVLFILLIIIGASFLNRGGYDGYC